MLLLVLPALHRIDPSLALVGHEVDLKEELERLVQKLLLGTLHLMELIIHELPLRRQK